MANITSDHIVIGDDTLVLQDADLRSKMVNAFQNSPDDSHYPSEKLVKDSLDAKLNNSQKGASNGVAGLDGNGKVPLSQLSTIPDVSTKYDTGDTASTEIADDDYVPFYDMSASGRRKTLWSNIKAKLKSYFDTLYLTAHQDISGKADKVSNPINGNLAKIDANGNLADSGVATSGVSDAVSKKHSHTNKSILDLIPTTLGTSGQVLSIGNNSNMEWRTPTSGSQGSSTLSGLTDTDIQSPSHGQFLRYDAEESKWVNDTFGGMFIATITTTEEGGVTTYSCDKTFDEIAAAIESGLRVRMFDVASGAVCENVCFITIGGFGFQGVGIDTSDITNDVNVFIFCMQNNGVDVFAVSYVSNLLPPMSGKSGKVLTNNGTKASWTDFPEELPSLSNQEGRYLRVKPTGGGVEWASVSVPEELFTCRFYYENNILKCTETVSKIILESSKKIVIGHLKEGSVDNIFLLRSTESSDGFAFFDTIYYSGSIMAKCLVGTTGNTDSWEFDDFPVPKELPSLQNNANKILAVNNSATGVEWINNSGGGLTNYDLTFSMLTTNTTNISFDANQQCYKRMTMTAGATLNFSIQNKGCNYLRIYNSSASDITIAIGTITYNNTAVNTKIVPDDAITVGAGKYVEIGITADASEADITVSGTLKAL